MKVQERIADYAVLAQDMELRPLGEVIKPTRPRVKPSEKPHLPFIGMEHVEAHTMRLLGTVPASTMKSSAVHFQPGDVLYGRLRPYLNKVYRPDFEGLCSAEFIVFPKTGSLDSRYLQYFLNSAEFVSFATHLNAGDRPRVDFDQLAPYPFPVRPLDQQKHIVAEIEKQFSRLDEAVANLKRVKANLKRYKAAVLKAAVEGRLVETEAESTAFGRQNWKPIGLAIGTLDQGWSPQCESEPAETDETWAVMKTTAVQPLRFSDEENKRLPPTLNPRANLELAAGDLLITRAGPRSRVGVTCLVKTTRPHLMLCDKAYRLRVKPDVALPGFLEIVLNSPDVLYVLDELKTGISDSGLNLTQKRFKELLVPLPPLAEQQRVIAEVERNLSLADEAEAQVNANLQRADRLRQSILSRAFIGVSASSTIAHTTL